MRINTIPGGNDPIKIEAVCQYLQEQFPDSEVRHEYDFDSREEKFTVQTKRHIRVSKAFLELATEQITEALTN